MTKRAIHRAAKKTAQLVTNMASSALLPSERRDYFQEVYRIVLELIQACRRQAGREHYRAKPNMN
jgi:hypothetical protein